MLNALRVGSEKTTSQARTGAYDEDSYEIAFLTLVVHRLLPSTGRRLKAGLFRSTTSCTLHHARSRKGNNFLIEGVTNGKALRMPVKHLQPEPGEKAGGDSASASLIVNISVPRPAPFAAQLQVILGINCCRQRSTFMR